MRPSLEIKQLVHKAVSSTTLTSQKRYTYVERPWPARKTNFRFARKTGSKDDVISAVFKLRVYLKTKNALI